MKMKSKTKRVIRQLLSTLAVLTILCQIPAGAATLTEDIQISAENMLAVLDNYPEDTSLRTEIEKHFHYGENGYIAAVYTDPVHYLDSNNEWQDIDNTLKLVAPSGNAIAATGSGNGYYENTANSFKVRLPQALSGTSNIQLQYADHALSFRMLNTSAVSTAAIDNTDNTDEKKLELLQQSRNAADTEKKDQLLQQAVTLLPNQAAGLTYANVQQNTHLVYRVDGQKLKESIILTAPTTQQSFSFAFTYTGLIPAVQEFGAVHFYADNQLNGEPIFIIQAPYMEDANTQEDTLCMDIDVTVTPTATGCIYTMTPNAEWLNDPARVYPITIDPTATTSTASADIQDNGVNQFNPTTNYMTVDRMYVGSNLSNGTAYESRIYIRFPRVSAISTSAFIHRATLMLDHYETSSYQSASNNIIDVYDVGNNNWSTSSITWNSQKGYSFGSRIDYETVNSPLSTTTKRNSFNITTVVRQWYKTTSSNNGIVLKPRSLDTTKTNRVCYFSSDCAATYTSKRPRIMIQYFNPPSAVTTPSNYGSYFIRNIHTGSYLTVEVGTGTNGQNVKCASFDGMDYQRWRMNTTSNSTYRFTSSVGMFNQYLDVTDGNVDIYTDFISTQQFTLSRYENTNMFNIKFGSGYVSVDADYNVYVSSTNMDADSLWCFVSVYGRITVTYPQTLSNPIPAKYSKSQSSSMTTQEGLNLIRTSRVLIVNCHGGPNGIDIGNGSVENDDILGLPTNDLQGVKLIVYSACATGGDNGNDINFVEATYQRGAQTVVGFNENVGEIVHNWCEGLMTSLSNGNTIHQAMLDGDEEGKNEWKSYENIKNRTVLGVTNVSVLEG